MKIATKTLTSLLIITMITLSSASAVGAASDSTDKKGESRFQRLTHRHDRKMQLRASVLQISPKELRSESKTADFDQILKRHGFKTRSAFRKAVAGKLKDELKKRGFSDQKIQKVVNKRLQRLVEKN